VARKTNYNFEKRQREIQKKEKKVAKLEAKRQKAEERKDEKVPDERDVQDGTGEVS
jgi:hypothetical protein